MRIRWYLLTALLLTAGVGASAQAQPAQGSGVAPARTETIALLPWRLANGTDGAKATARQFLVDVLTRAQMDVVSPIRAQAAWREANGAEFDPDSGTLPTPAQMLRVGEKLGVDWVIAGSAEWHSRSIWVGLGPKTKSTCTLSVRIVDVKNQVVAREVKGLKMDSTAKEEGLKAAGALLLTPLFTVVSGGPKTPHEQRAVQLGIAKALDPWLVQRLKAEKIDPTAK